VGTRFADQVQDALPRVTAVVRRLAGNEAEDVVQEAVLRAFLSLSQLRDPERFEGWLCGIAINVAKMRLRSAATHARALAALEAAPAVEEHEFLELVRDAVAVLPDAQRQAVLLHYVDGLSCEEIAALAGTTPGAVRVRLHRARAQLRRDLAPNFARTPTRRERPMIELQVDDVVVRVAEDEPGRLVSDSRVIVLAEREGERVLPIWIGASEGNALALQLHSGPLPRPFTHDLMVELIRALGGSVERVAITRLEDEVFYAEVHVGGEELDARPSDAVNLAVRTGAPIVAVGDVLAAAGVARSELDSTIEAKWPTDELPPGRWASLSGELLQGLHTLPRR
jgi:RNA polymerase sigma factor (sigma-70 family)